MPFFDQKEVSHSYYINLERSKDRNATFEDQARRLGFELGSAEGQMTRVPGADGYQLLENYNRPEEQREDTGVDVKDILHRSKREAPVPPGIDWLDPIEADMVLPEGTASLPEDDKHIMGQYGCRASHVKAMKQALRDCAPGDNRWIVIFEDDSLIPAEQQDYINLALRNAPENAGAIMLAAKHRLLNGSIPVETNSPEFALPTQARTTTAIAYRPEMLRVMLDVYERNLKMPYDKGGISSLSNVNSIIQEYTTLGYIPDKDKHKDYKILIDTFRRGIRKYNAKAHLFYTLNPCPVVTTGVDSDTGNMVNPDDSSLALTLQAFPRENVKQVKEIMGVLHSEAAKRDARRVINEAVKEGTHTPENTLRLLSRIQQADARINHATNQALSKM